MSSEIGPKPSCGHDAWNWRTESACPACFREMRGELKRLRVQLSGKTNYQCVCDNPNDYDVIHICTHCGGQSP